MTPVRCCQVDRIKRARLESFAVLFVAEGRLHVVLLCELPGLFRIAGDDSRKLRVAGVLDTGQHVFLCDIPSTYYGVADLFL